MDADDTQPTLKSVVPFTSSVKVHDFILGITVTPSALTIFVVIELLLITLLHL